MRNKILLILGLIFLASSIVAAQKARKTITNFDLEKYRVQREKAEADYLENYEKRGMPSPEELQKREEVNSIKREELSRRLAVERQQAEQTKLQMQIAEQNARINYPNNSANQLSGTQIFSGSYPIYGSSMILNNDYYNRSRWHRPGYPYRGNYPQIVPNQPTVVVGGGMIYTVPRSSSTPQPIIVRPRFGRRY